MVGPGDRRGGEGSGASHLTFPLTCARAAIPFVAQAALTAVASAAHGLGCAGWSTHRLQLCPPGPTPHIQVSGCPPRPPSTSVCSWGMHWCVQVYTSVQGGHKHRAHSPSCTSQCGPVQPSSQKQEPEPPKPSSQWPWEVQLQAGERDRQDGVGTWAMGIREQDRAGSDRIAYLGKGAQRHPGHRVHMPSRQTSNGTYSTRCRSCRPCTCHGHYRGCWHPQGKLGVRVGEERWGQGLSSGTAHMHPQPSHTVHLPPSGSRGSCRSSNPPKSPRPGEHPDPSTPHQVLYHLHTHPSS